MLPMFNRGRSTRSVCVLNHCSGGPPRPWGKTLLTWGSVELQVWLRVREAVDTEEAMEGDECFHRKSAGDVQTVPLEF